MSVTADELRVPKFSNAIGIRFGQISILAYLYYYYYIYIFIDNCLSYQHMA